MDLQAPLLNEFGQLPLLRIEIALQQLALVLREALLQRLRERLQSKQLLRQAKPAALALFPDMQQSAIHESSVWAHAERRSGCYSETRAEPCSGLVQVVLRRGYSSYCTLLTVTRLSFCSPKDVPEALKQLAGLVLFCDLIPSPPIRAPSFLSHCGDCAACMTSECL